MNPRFRTQDVAKTSYVNYLKKSDECYKAAAESLSRNHWNAAAICAVHSCIAACDAYCIYFLGKRHQGSNHNDAILVFATIKPADEQLKNNANRLRGILGIKNMAEYEERLVRRGEAEKAFKDAERFLAFVRNELPEAKTKNGEF
jgi:HEPN domain-containing protein